MSETLLNDGAPTPPVDQAAQTGDAGAAAPAVQADATQQPPAGDASAAKPDEAAAPPVVVPDKYEFKTADGALIEGELVGEFEGIAKELKLSQEAASKVVELGTKMEAQFSARQAEALTAAQAEWEATSAADKEFGGEKFVENLGLAKKALDDLGTPELKELLGKSKLVSHPEVIRLLVRAGKAISQDSKVVTGGPGLTSIESAAKRMYPNMNP